MRGLTGRTAVITGAASGIGRAMAERLLAEGMQVVVSDVDADGLGSAVAALGDAAAPVVADVASEDDVVRLADAAHARFGAVHLLCANAGVSAAGGAPLWETTAGDWGWVLGVNLMGVANVVRAFLPRMLDGGQEGHIVITASLSGLVSFPHAGPYGVSKHATVSLGEQLALELMLKRAPIGVSVLCPAWVRTDILRSERHRPARFRAGQAAEPPAALAAAMAAEGLDPAEVAEQAVAAVRDGRFWVLPEGGWAGAVEQRAERIAAGEPPRLLRPRSGPATGELSRLPRPRSGAPRDARQLRS
ncbi:MAG TPA: SDR family NAD(P)-dependent oxidoreductase [Egibacteraceae bacterium]|nr:SDR family NAD(P)-dependent oxidoreductase [Egibacteraceae bacterium]